MMIKQLQALLNDKNTYTVTLNRKELEELMKEIEQIKRLKGER